MYVELQTKTGAVNVNSDKVMAVADTAPDGTSGAAMCSVVMETGYSVLVLSTADDVLALLSSPEKPGLPDKPVIGDKPGPGR